MQTGPGSTQLEWVGRGVVGVVGGVTQGNALPEGGSHLPHT